MATQEDWRLRNVIRSDTFISGDSSFPWYIEASPHCNNLRREANKEGSTRPQTSVREINSNKLVEMRGSYHDLSRLIRRWSLAVGACLAISQKDHWAGLDCPALWDVLLVPSVAENVTEP